MCGLTGTYLFKKGDLNIAYTQWCLQTMRHRGPDASGIWHNTENYIAGFVRLAVRDLTANGNQPMLTDDKQYCISFNGEIYNVDFLKQQLIGYRKTFHSNTDTEVLLHALAYLGVEKTLTLADGIFAFAFFDVSQNKLTLARDRVGTKPLYVGTTTQGVVYSSQYDHVINHPFLQNQVLDGGALSSYLQLGYMAEGTGLVANTTMLPHGHYATVENNTVTFKEYYAFPAKNSSERDSLEKTISSSVSSQLVSDVPTGTFMSGGVDSTLVSYFAGQQAPLQSFTIGMPDARLDEASVATQFAEAFDTNHHTKYLTEQELLPLLQQNVAAFSEPFADYSSLPTLLLSQFAKQKITVALSGDGGDELFWGYPRNSKILKTLSLYQQSPLLRKRALLVSKLCSPITTDIRRHWNEQNFVSYAFSNMFIQGAHRWANEVCIAPPASPFFVSKAKDLFNVEMSENGYMNLLRKMEMDIHLQRILLKVDRASMYHSLEVRVPLLSNAMLQLATQFSYDSCIGNQLGKLPLRRLLSEKVGNTLALQPKKGFTVPMDMWIRTILKKEIEETIMDMPAALSAFFNRKKLQQLLVAHSSKKEDAGWFIWAVYSLVKWHQTHVNKTPAFI